MQSSSGGPPLVSDGNRRRYPQPDIMQRKNLNNRSQSDPSAKSFGNSPIKGGQKDSGDRKDVRQWCGRTKPSDSTRQDSSELTDTQSARTWPTWVSTRSSVYLLWFLARWFYEMLGCGNMWVSYIYACSWDYFPHIGLLCSTSIY